MITVVHLTTGDRVEAPDEGAAVLAARTLREDADLASARQRTHRDRIAFYVAGQLVRTLDAVELG